MGGQLTPDTAEADGLDLGDFEDASALGAVDTPTGLQQFLDFTKDFDDNELAITAEVAGLDPERTALLRDILRAADIADADDVTDIETASNNLRARIGGLPDTGRNDRARFEQFLDGAVRASGIPNAVRRGSGTMSDGILKSEGKSLFEIVREDPMKVAAVLTGAGVGGRIGRAALAPLIRDRTLSADLLSKGAAKVRAQLGKHVRASLDRIDPGRVNSQVRDAVTHILDGAVESTKPGSVPNFDKKGGLREMLADFEAAIRNAGGNPNNSKSLGSRFGKWNELPDGSKILWRMMQDGTKKTVEVQIKRSRRKNDEKPPLLKVRYKFLIRQ